MVLHDGLNCSAIWYVIAFFIPIFDMCAIAAHEQVIWVLVLLKLELGEVTGHHLPCMCTQQVGPFGPTFPSSAWPSCVTAMLAP
jgi:hypothetical protein